MEVVKNHYGFSKQLSCLVRRKHRESTTFTVRLVFGGLLRLVRRCLLGWNGLLSTAWWGHPRHLL